MSGLVVVCGACVGLGLILGTTRRSEHALARRRGVRPASRLLLRVAAGVTGAAVVGVATRWPIAALVAGVAGAILAGGSSGRGQTRRDTETIEALASWAEQLRDTLVAGQGITETIRSTADISPLAIRGTVQTLARRIQHQRLGTALRTWADDLDNATADLIASVLLLAATRSGRDVGQLLSATADVARDRVALRLRIDARRSAVRSEARSLIGFSLVFFVGLAAFGGSFMEPYRSVSGQLVLLGVASLAGLALWWLSALSRFRPTPRVLVASEEPAK